jgi:hypothetical protein
VSVNGSVQSLKRKKSNDGYTFYGLEWIDDITGMPCSRPNPKPSAHSSVPQAWKKNNPLSKTKVKNVAPACKKSGGIVLQF